MSILANHVRAPHWPWRQYGSTVACGCGVELYRGAKPESQEVATHFAAFLDEVIRAAVERWADRMPTGIISNGHNVGVQTRRE